MDAGWYPDAEQADVQRYWDGTQWTDHTAPSAPPVVAPVVAPIEPSPFSAPAPQPAPVTATQPAVAIPAPGWLADPEVPGGQRYWDGERWTDHRTGPPAANAGGYPQPQAAYGAPGAGAGYGYGAPVVAAKSPALSLILSFFFPGVGSMVNGDVGKGIGILIGYLVALVFSVLLIGIPFALGLWIWGMVDGYQGAVKWNARHGIIS